MRTFPAKIADHPGFTGKTNERARLHRLSPNDAIAAQAARPPDRSDRTICWEE